LIPTFVWLALALFFIVWIIIYRYAHWRDYRQGSPIHKYEMIRRAEEDSAIAITRAKDAEDYAAIDAQKSESEWERERARRAELDRQRVEQEQRERVRRAIWDAEHAPLLAPGDLQTRIRNRWSVTSVVQGFSALATALFASAVFWQGDKDTRSDGDTSGPPATIPQGPNANSWIALVDNNSVGVISTCVVFLSAGAILLLLAKSRASRGIGVALIATAPFISGFAFFKIDKPSIKFDRLFTYNETQDKSKFSKNNIPPHESIVYLSRGGKPEERQPFDAVITMAPFPSGTAKPDKRLNCAIARLAVKLASTPQVDSIVIQAAADRRELLPDTRRQYGSNWALAQQRGGCIARAVSAHGFPRERIFVTNAGPSYTAGSLIEADLEVDRSVVIFVRGHGPRPDWIIQLPSSTDNLYCADDASEPVEFC
jgi:flagellar motor protein MotB